MSLNDIGDQFTNTEDNNMNTSDIAFMLIATAMVLLMTPGLALFYGGMVRTKNSLATIMLSFICLGVISIVWVLYGYSLAFGPDVGSFIGDLSYLGLKGVGLEASPPADNIPHLLFCAFQLMFAIITPALIFGAVAGLVAITPGAGLSAPFRYSHWPGGWGNLLSGRYW